MNEAKGKVWIVGQAPSRASDAAFPFRGRSGARLLELIGCPICGGAKKVTSSAGGSFERSFVTAGGGKAKLSIAHFQATVNATCECVDKPDAVLRAVGFRLVN